MLGWGVFCIVGSPSCPWLALPGAVEGIHPLAGGHRLVLSDGACLEAGLTVMADGGRSGLKERLGIESRERPYEQVAVVTTVGSIAPMRASPMSVSRAPAPLPCCP